MNKELKRELAELKRQKQQLDYERKKRLKKLEDGTLVKKVEVIKEIEKIVQMSPPELTFWEKVRAVFLHKIGG